MRVENRKIWTRLLWFHWNYIKRVNSDKAAFNSRELWNLFIVLFCTNHFSRSATAPLAHAENSQRRFFATSQLPNTTCHNAWKAILNGISFNQTSRSLILLFHILLCRVWYRNIRNRSYTLYTLFVGTTTCIT